MTEQEIQEGTVIQGTLRDEDLIAAFYRELEKVAPLTAKIRCEGTWKEEIEHALAGKDFEQWPEQDWVKWALEALMGDLESNAPKGMYFGCTDGSYSDYGWWYVPDYDNFEREDWDG